MAKLWQHSELALSNAQSIPNATAVMNPKDKTAMARFNRWVISMLSSFAGRPAIEACAVSHTRSDYLKPKCDFQAKKRIDNINSHIRLLQSISNK